MIHAIIGTRITTSSVVDVVTLLVLRLMLLVGNGDFSHNSRDVDLNLFADKSGSKYCLTIIGVLREMRVETANRGRNLRGWSWH